MREDQKKQIAVFRFGVIHEFVGGVVLDYGEQARHPPESHYGLPVPA